MYAIDPTHTQTSSPHVEVGNAALANHDGHPDTQGRVVAEMAEEGLRAMHGGSKESWSCKHGVQSSAAAMAMGEACSTDEASASGKTHVGSKVAEMVG